MKLTPDIIAAARRLKNDLAFQETMKYLRRAAFDAFVSSDPVAKDEREAIYQRVQALDDIQATLRNIAQEAETGEK